MNRSNSCNSLEILKSLISNPANFKKHTSEDIYSIPIETLLKEVPGVLPYILNDCTRSPYAYPVERILEYIDIKFRSDPMCYWTYKIPPRWMPREHAIKIQEKLIDQRYNHLVSVMINRIPQEYKLPEIRMLEHRRRRPSVRGTIKRFFSRSDRSKSSQNLMNILNSPKDTDNTIPNTDPKNMYNTLHNTVPNNMSGIADNTTKPTIKNVNRKIDNHSTFRLHDERRFIQLPDRNDVSRQIGFTQLPDKNDVSRQIGFTQLPDRNDVSRQIAITPKNNREINCENKEINRDINQENNIKEIRKNKKDRVESPNEEFGGLGLWG